MNYEDETVLSWVLTLAFILILVTLASILILAVMPGHCQTASAGIQPNFTNTVVMTDHPQHATARDIRTDGGETEGHGERPVMDYPETLKPETPLGDVARYYRTHRYVPLREGGK